MADNEKKHVDISNLIGGAIPPEVAEQLRILGRVQFSPKDTRPSAVSRSAEEFVHPDEEQARRDEDDILAHVGEMEDLTEQMEDMIDELTKDMAIPVTPGTSLAAAVRDLGGDDVIDRGVMDNALAIIDNAPSLYGIGDPFLAGLGDGKLDGPFMNCSEITRAAAEAWNTANPQSRNPETPILDTSSKLAEEFEEKKGNLILEMIQMLFWNILWAKYIVDLVIINPARMMVANPLDSIILFFKWKCGKRPFKKKPKSCLKKHGPINRILNKLRCILLCQPPKLLWSLERYKPMVEDFDCDCRKNLGNCPEDSKEANINPKGNLTEFGNMLSQLFSEDEPCIDKNDIIENADTRTSNKFGAPPQCLSSAKIVLDAVVSDAMSPKDPGEFGNPESVRDIIEEQTRNTGAA